jgi:DNA-binding protein HU-beta/integration host factor subunit beta
MSNITKRDLVERISEKTGLTQVDTKIVIESFLEAISHALEKGRHIEIRGFGRFKIKKKNPRLARNPRTGEQIHVDETFKPIFKASNELRKRVNESQMSLQPAAAETSQPEAAE